MGKPSLFVRLNGCNLSCHFANGSKCDTAYASICAEEGTYYDTADLARVIGKELDKHCGYPDIVFTGGEPMIQQDALVQVIQYLREREECYNDITIETNGTVIPSPDLLKNDAILWSVSPKLESSCHFPDDFAKGRIKFHRDHRINLEALGTIAAEAAGSYQFKFVYSGGQDIQEIRDILQEVRLDILNLADSCDDDADWMVENADQIEDHVYLMPEGETQEQLIANAPRTIEAVLDQGWKYTDRLQIRLWGTRRAV